MVYAFSVALLVNAGSFSLYHGRYQGIGTCDIRYSGIGQVLMAGAARLAESGCGMPCKSPLCKERWCSKHSSQLKNGLISMPSDANKSENSYFLYLS